MAGKPTYWTNWALPFLGPIAGQVGLPAAGDQLVTAATAIGDGEKLSMMFIEGRVAVSATTPANINLDWWGQTSIQVGLFSDFGNPAFVGGPFTPFTGTPTQPLLSALLCPRIEPDPLKTNGYCVRYEVPRGVSLVNEAGHGTFKGAGGTFASLYLAWAWNSTQAPPLLNVTQFGTFASMSLTAAGRTLWQLA